jgi:hypothetical protein
MRKIAILAATLAATACWIPGASAQNQPNSLTGNLSTTDLQHVVTGLGQAEFGFRSNDMSVARSGTGAMAGTGGMERRDLSNPAAATAGFAASNPAIKP